MRSLRPFHTHPTHQATELLREVREVGEGWRMQVCVWECVKWVLVMVRVKGPEVDWSGDLAVDGEGEPSR